MLTKEEKKGLAERGAISAAYLLITQVVNILLYSKGHYTGRDALLILAGCSLIALLHFLVGAFFVGGIGHLLLGKDPLGK